MAFQGETGRTFQPKDFRQVGMVGPYDLYQVKPKDFFRVMEDEEGVEKIEWDRFYPVEEEAITISYGANPCVILLPLHTSNSPVPLIGHFMEIQEPMLQQIRQTTVGVAGGGMDMLTELKDELISHGFTILWPQGNKTVFDLGIVRRALPDVPKGVFFNYLKE